MGAGPCPLVPPWVKQPGLTNPPYPLETSTHPAQKMLLYRESKSSPGPPFLPDRGLCLDSHPSVNIGNAVALASGHTSASKVQSLFVCRSWDRDAPALVAALTPAFAQRVWPGFGDCTCPQPRVPGLPCTSHPSHSSHRSRLRARWP